MRTGRARGYRWRVTTGHGPPHAASDGAARWQVTWDGDGRAVVALAGDLDMDADPGFRAAIDRILEHDPVPTEIVLNLAQLEFIDSGGVRALIVSHGAAKRRGVPLRVENPRPAPARVLQITQVDRLLGLRMPTETRRPHNWR